ncbi:DsbA family protein [Pseudogemmobacter humi]|uniref:Disulfide bond formation protein D n=1 Tax=Pseudogemmobacter humi TaxID=2483812 RepID=A0A3P5WZP2_9RHOB|nr:DsbA family protein [Pseudogemmobacter humi]VDC20394.1 Disulfide bond formation protein D precursor [Pseudogemmobacter humi]
MTSINRRALIALAAAVAAAPAWAEEAAPGEAAAAPAPAPVDFTLGDENAPVKIIEYASYTCPHCANFHETVFKPLKAEYIDTGKVHFTLREVYFDRYGFWAALVARCGEGKRYGAISDMIFSRQRDWMNSDDPAAVMENLRVIGISAGLTREEIAVCEQDTAHGDALLARFETHMKTDQIKGTPAILVDGELIGNPAWADLKAMIDSKLGG